MQDPVLRSCPKQITSFTSGDYQKHITNNYMNQAES